MRLHEAEQAFRVVAEDERQVDRGGGVTLCWSTVSVATGG